MMTRLLARARRLAHDTASHALALRLRAQRRFGRSLRHGLPSKLVLSLTSYPKRYPTLDLTLRSLLRQTVAPDEIVLWVTAADRGTLPPRVLGLQDAGLTVRTTRELRSFKKIVPALEHDPQAFVVTADDDLFYPRTWLADLLGRFTDPRTIVCHRAHEILFTPDGATRSYRDWPMEVGRKERSQSIMPTNGAGTLFPPGSLHPDATREDVFLDLCPFADDLWLYFMAVRQGCRFTTVDEGFRLWEWPEAAASGLWLANVFEGRNDAAIHALEGRYGRIHDLQKDAATSG